MFLGVGVPINRRNFLFGASAVAAAALLSGEDDGFAADFTYSEDTAKMIGVKASGVLTEHEPDAFLTNAGTSPKQKTNSLGVVDWSPHNMVVQSDDMGTSWTLSSITAPAADELTEVAASATHFTTSSSITTIAGATYTITVEVSKKGRDYVGIAYRESGSDQNSVFNLTTGAKESDVAGNSSTITDIGGGYYRLTVTRTATTTSANIRILVMATSAVGAYLGDITKGLFVRKVQMNRGTVPTDYLATTTAARYGLALDHDPVTLEPRGLLVEPAATNIVTPSAPGTGWFSTKTTITANSTAAPNGRTEASLIQDNASGAGSSFAATPSLTLANSTVYTASVYVKPNGSTWFYFYLIGQPSPGAGGIYFNLSGDGAVGTVDSGRTGTIRKIGSNGWYRVTLTFTSDPADTTGEFRCYMADGNGDITLAGNGSSSLYLWGMQVETGSVATSLIPTFGSAITRSADNDNHPTSSLTFYSATAGMVAIGAKTRGANAVEQTLFNLGDGTANERIRIFRNTSKEIHVAVIDGGVTQADINLGTVENSTAFTVAISWAANSIKASLNAGSVTTDASATLPTMTTFRYGAAAAAGTEWGGYIEKALYLPRVAANDAELVSIQSRVAA